MALLECAEMTSSSSNKSTYLFPGLLTGHRQEGASHKDEEEGNAD